MKQVLAEDFLKAGSSPERARCISAAVTRLLQQSHLQRPEDAWRHISKCILRPDDPLNVHVSVLHAVFNEWDVQRQGPIPVWMPVPEGIQDTNLAAFMGRFQGPARWQEGRTGKPPRDLPLLQQISYSDPEEFWAPVLHHLRIKFRTPPSRMLQTARSPDNVRWLPGAQLNIAESALSMRDPDAPALIWAAEEAPDTLHTLSLGGLHREAMRFAAALRTAGFSPGQAIAIAMPMTLEAVMAYFGIVLAGCAAVSIADSFAASEMASRLRIANVAAVVTQDVIGRGSKVHPLYARIVEARAAKAIVIPAQPAKGFQVQLRQGDVSWHDFMASVPADASFEPRITDAYAVTNILFSSGTTGEPKAIPWTHVTPIRCGVDAWAQQDIRPGDVAAWPTNLGWMMGPWLLYAALLNGAAIALFQGSPLGRPFGVFVDQARVTMLGLVPSIARAWRASNCMHGLQWAALRCFSSTGEASAPEDYHWLMAMAGYKPVIEICGGTEIGGGFLAGSMLQPQCPSTFSTATMGPCDGVPQKLIGILEKLIGIRRSKDAMWRLHIELLKADGEKSLHRSSRAVAGSNFALLTAEGEQSLHGSSRAVAGEFAIVPPFLGSSQRLLNRDHYSVYYKDMASLSGSQTPLRRHGDEFERLPNGYYRALGRCDDTMNLGGIKVSSVELERACVEGVPDVQEAAAVGVPSPGGGPEQLLLFLVPRSPGAASSTKNIKAQCQAAIRAKLNPLFKVERMVWRDSLPRTASNKVMRRLLRDEVKGHAKL